MLVTNARPYAKALFISATQQQRLDLVQQWLQALSMVIAHANVKKLLADPQVGEAKILAIFLEVLGDKLTTSDKNFLFLLAEKRCMEIMPAILAIYEQLHLAHLNTLPVTAFSARALTVAQASALQQTLVTKYNCHIQLTYHVAPELLGGMVLHIGDKVIDGSVSGQLQQLTQSINA